MMSKAMCWIGAFVALIVLVNGAQPVQAQVAPTNSAAITGSVSDALGNPVATATVTLSGPKNVSIHTDGHGLFVFLGMPFGTYEILATAPGLGTISQENVIVQGDTTIAIHYQPTGNLKTIAHVSSDTAASFNVSATSVTQINPKEQAFAGQTSWKSLLEEIPGVSVAGFGKGAFVEGYGAVAGSPFQSVQISIDGSLPYEDQVTLDGMPLIGSGIYSVNGFASMGAGTNLGQYPMNSFDAVDVVRGPGAYAPSIFDSIGGTLLLHGAGPVFHNSTDFSISTDPYGGIVTNFSVAWHYKKLSGTFTYGVNHSPGPEQGAESYIFPPKAVNGVPFKNCSCYSVSLAPVGSPAYIVTNFIECCVPVSDAWNVHSGGASLIYAFSPRITASVAYSGQSMNQIYGTTDFATLFQTTSGYTGVLPGGVTNTASFNGDFGYYQQGGFITEEKLSATIGRGVLTLAGLQNRSSYLQRRSIPPSMVTSLYGPGCLAQSGAPADPRCGNTAGYVYTLFNGNVVTANNSLEDTVLADGVNFNRDLSLSYTTPVGENAHAGLSFVKTYYADDYFCGVQGEGLYPTYSLFNTISDVETTDTNATTREYRLFFGGNPSPKTSVDLSMYFAQADFHVPNPNDPNVNFGSFGYFSGLPYGSWIDKRFSYSAPRLGFVWRPTASVSLRASIGGGFALQSVGALVTSANGKPAYQGPNLQYPLGFYQQGIANLNEQPEKSFGFVVGTDIRLPHDTVVSLDLYQDNIFGQIYSDTQPSGTYDDGMNGPAPLLIQETGNLGETRFKGVLASIHHSPSHGLSWSVDAGLTRGYLISVPGNFYNAPGQVCNFATNVGCVNQTVVTNINFNGCFAGTVPYSQGHLGLGYGWTSGRSVGLNVVYYGNNNSWYEPAFFILNGNVALPLNNRAKLLFNFGNILGTYSGSRFVYTRYPNIVNAPTVAGSPRALFGEPYGPRTAQAVLQFHM